MSLPMRQIKTLIKALLPQDANSNYLGFRVYHHKEDSLMVRVKPPITERLVKKLTRRRTHDIYEEMEFNVVRELLHDVKAPIVLDIGANIGLMALNILTFNRHAKIFAFEPGPQQFKYLSRTINYNKLHDRIKAFNLALASAEGEVEFVIHKPGDSSGDGLVDTGRAGSSEKISIKSDTLDGWWSKNGEPKVDFVKIDTEGAELLILAKGRELIRRQRPAFLIEIVALNFEKYGYSYQDYIDFFAGVDYHLLNAATNEPLTLGRNSWPSESFVAFPKNRPIGSTGLKKAFIGKCE